MASDNCFAPANAAQDPEVDAEPSGVVVNDAVSPVKRTVHAMDGIHLPDSITDFTNPQAFPAIAGDSSDAPEESDNPFLLPSPSHSLSSADDHSSLSSSHRENEDLFLLDAENDDDNEQLAMMDMPVPGWCLPRERPAFKVAVLGIWLPTRKRFQRVPLLSHEEEEKKKEGETQDEVSVELFDNGYYGADGGLVCFRAERNRESLAEALQRPEVTRDFNMVQGLCLDRKPLAFVCMASSSSRNTRRTTRAVRSNTTTRSESESDSPSRSRSRSPRGDRWRVLCLGWTPEACPILVAEQDCATSERIVCGMARRSGVARDVPRCLARLMANFIPHFRLFFLGDRTRSKDALDVPLQALVEELSIQQKSEWTSW